MSALSTLQLSDVTRLGTTIRSLTTTSSMESVATRIVRCLYDQLVEPDDARSTVLVRFYITAEYGSLDEELQAFGARVAQGHTLTKSTRCLTLLATAGDRPAWNDRHQSQGHRAIPLPSEEVVQALPMVAQLVAQLGVSVATVVRPDPALVLEAEQHSYNVFFVPDAQGSPYIPAQSEFVVPCGVRSVLGFGGLLPSADVFAVLLFSRVVVPRNVADTFRNLALNTKMALLSSAGHPMFEPPQGRHHG